MEEEEDAWTKMMDKLTPHDAAEMETFKAFLKEKGLQPKNSGKTPQQIYDEFYYTDDSHQNPDVN